MEQRRKLFSELQEVVDLEEVQRNTALPLINYRSSTE
jgi:hypothetical protein